MAELNPEMIEWAEKSDLKFMDRDGIKTGVELPGNCMWLNHEPMVMVAGREVFVYGPGKDGKPKDGPIWHLRLESFFKYLEDGTILFYYAPIPRNLEIPEEWRTG